MLRARYGPLGRWLWGQFDWRHWARSALPSPVGTVSPCLLITQVLRACGSRGRLKHARWGLHRNRPVHQQIWAGTAPTHGPQGSPTHGRGRRRTASIWIQAMDIEKVNSMDFGEFVDVFGNVIERCPLIAAAVWSQRPFSDLEDLEKHFLAFIDALPQSGKAWALDPAILHEGVQTLLWKHFWVVQPRGL